MYSSSNCSDESKSGLTLVELLIVVAIAGIFIVIFTYAIANQREKSRQSRCKSNLEIMGMALHQYVLLGNGSHLEPKQYPLANGGGFLARLYQTKIIRDTKIFRCPSTRDVVTEESLNHLYAEDPDSSNCISYAGRKNANPLKYTHFPCDTGLTSMASDDFQGTSNHENGKLAIILYFDGHVDTHRDASARENDYQAFAGPENDYIAEPLTN